MLFGTARNQLPDRAFRRRACRSRSHPGAADYGLLFIAPVGSHYALVSSGLPWWTGADEARRGGYPFAPARYRLLATFGDYVLFKGSLAHVVAEGRFDRNWKVPPKRPRSLTATGTVTVH